MFLFSRAALAAAVVCTLALAGCQSAPGGDARGATVNRVIANDGIGQADDN